MFMKNKCLHPLWRCRYLSKGSSFQSWQFINPSSKISIIPLSSLSTLYRLENVIIQIPCCHWLFRPQYSWHVRGFNPSVLHRQLCPSWSPVLPAGPWMPLQKTMKEAQTVMSIKISPQEQLVSGALKVRHAVTTGYFVAGKVDLFEGNKVKARSLCEATVSTWFFSGLKRPRTS